MVHLIFLQAAVIILCDSILMVSTVFRMQRYSDVDSWLVFLACVPTFWLAWSMTLAALSLRMTHDGTRDSTPNTLRLHSRPWAMVVVLILVFTSLLRGAFIYKDYDTSQGLQGLGSVSHDWEKILCGVAGVCALTISLGYICHYNILSQSSSRVLSSFWAVQRIVRAVAVCFQLLALGLFCATWDEHAIKRRDMDSELLSITYVIIASLFGAVFLSVKKGIPPKMYTIVSCSLVGLLNIIALYTLPYPTIRCMEETREVERIACVHDDRFYVVLFAVVCIVCVFTSVTYYVIR